MKIVLDEKKHFCTYAISKEIWHRQLFPMETMGTNENKLELQKAWVSKNKSYLFGSMSLLKSTVN